MKALMKVFFYFGRRKTTALFHALAQYWSKNYGLSEFAGLVVAKDRDHADFLERQRDVQYRFIDRLEDIEDASLAAKVDEAEMAEWERQLGFSLMRFVVADRHIGHFYNTAGIVSPSPIMRLANDPDVLRKLIYHHLKYLQSRIREFKPTAVISGGAASMYALMLVRVCQLEGIPCLWVYPTRIMDRYSILDNISEVHDGVIQDFEAALHGSGDLSEYWQEAEAYVDGFQQASEAPEYYTSKYEGDIIKQRYDVGWLRLFARELGAAFPQFVKGAFNAVRGRPRRYLRRKRLVDKTALKVRQSVEWKRTVDRYSEEAIPKKEYIYFPLSVNPEASTMVVAPNFVDPLMVIECLSKNVPSSMEIYVKEHRPMVGLRKRSFYDKLRSFPNVRFISALADGVSLMRNARLTVVVTGTSGWESLLVGTPVLTFAQTSYTSIGLTRTCTDLDQIGHVIRELLDHGFGMSDSDRHRRLVAFVAATLKHSFVLKRADLRREGGRPGAYDADSPVIKVLGEAFTDALRRKSVQMPVLGSASGD